MKITVTEWDIKHGKKADIRLCPLAIAITKHTGRFNLLVFMKTVRIGVMTYELTEEAWQFYRDFDAGLKVEPFSFEIPYEDEDDLERGLS